MSDNSNPTVYLGFITFGALTAPYLSTFLESLAKQTFKDYKVVVYDNTVAKETEHLKILPDTVDIYRSSENIGFSRAYNKLISEAINKGAKYFLVINPDTYLMPDALEKLVKSLEADETLANACPKLLQWDFKNNQLTNIIDSCGLVMRPGLAFSDLGQAEVDNGQYDKASIIGPSGAAALFRLSALEKVKEENAYFDDNFFMYKEDCDLAYRLNLAGFKSQLIPEAIVYHDRTSSGGNLWQKFVKRRSRSLDVRRWAFINQHFLFFKYWSKQSFYSRLMILVRAKIMFLNALLFEQALLASYKTIFKQAKKLKRY
ncbi:MAG: glycosyltransferase family 2 protein [Candidatus Falkowbacteria bacterium]|nr:glycosyltransferase family 2 protein [Candidatus Falkowbacteria bacterium]